MEKIYKGETYQTDCDCDDCMKVIKMIKEDEMALSSSSGKVHACNSCGNHVDSREQPMFISCSACWTTIQNGHKQTQDRLANLEQEVDVSRKSLVQRDQQMVYAKQKMEAALRVEQHDAQHLRQTMYERELAQSAASLWREAYYHRTSGECQYCSGKVKCPELEIIEERALSNNPDYDCPKCSNADANQAYMRKALESSKEFFDHIRFCKHCAHYQGWETCKERLQLRDAARHLLSDALMSDHGKKMLQRLRAALTDFSFLGEYAAVVYIQEMGYAVIELEKGEAWDHQFKGKGETPKAAVEKARQNKVFKKKLHVST